MFLAVYLFLGKIMLGEGILRDGSVLIVHKTCFDITVDPEGPPSRPILWPSFHKKCQFLEKIQPNKFEA